MNLISVEGISKTYGDKLLFSDVSFGLARGDKTALVASNGSGKTTILRILAGVEVPDTGKIDYRSDLQIGFLEQDPVFKGVVTVNELIESINSRVSEEEEDWDIERRFTEILTLFKITDRDKKISLLSGGEKKRLALAKLLLDKPELLILDEPTNHLDIDMIEWLEKHLSQANITLFMVTHDRFFLDRICNHLVELSEERIFHHNGNYEYFVTKKTEREMNWQVETEKAKQLMKKELEWIRRMPKARTTKSKSRIDAFYQTKEKAQQRTDESELQLDVKMSRIGGKILEIDSLEKSYGDKKIVSDFNYVFKKGERIGIIGPNGSGKTTFLNLITGNELPDKGTIVKGETIIFGYYKQKGIEADASKTVLDVVKEIQEVVDVGKGKRLSASQFLNYFMFPPNVQYKLVSKLSGGERRRLYLLTVLLKNPNFLILDEPTNDLDILVLNRLEEFLTEYKGCLILVSHDRYFLEKLSDHLFVFEGNGKIKDFYGSYHHYKSSIISEQTSARSQSADKNQTSTSNGTKPSKPPKPKTKLSFNEKREYEQLEKDIELLEIEKAELEEKLNSGQLEYPELNTVTTRIGELIETIDEKTLRWMELDEYV